MSVLEGFIGLDGEMTGSGSREKDLTFFRTYQLIQIGLAVDESAPSRSWTGPQLYRSDIGFDQWNEQEEAMQVNGFTADRIRAAPRPKAVDAEARRFLDTYAKTNFGLKAVGWNVGSFDMPFVREYLPMVADRFSYRSVDLNSIVFAMTDDFDSYNTLKRRAKQAAEDALRAKLGNADWHDAGYDAAAALESFRFLKATYKGFEQRIEELQGLVKQRDNTIKDLKQLTKQWELWTRFPGEFKQPFFQLPAKLANKKKRNEK